MLILFVLVVNNWLGKEGETLHIFFVNHLSSFIIFKLIITTETLWSNKVSLSNYQHNLLPNQFTNGSACLRRNTLNCVLLLEGDKISFNHTSKGFRTHHS